jgi:hypothetical protein
MPSPVVRKQRGFFHADRRELLEPRGRVPVVARQDLVVAGRGREPLALAAAALADRRGLDGQRDVRHAERSAAPAQYTRPSASTSKRNAS